MDAPRLLSAAAWTGTLIAVFPSAALARGLAPSLPAPAVLGARAALLIALLAGAFAADALKPLRGYFSVLLIIFASEAVPGFFSWARGGEGSASVLQFQAANQAMRIVSTAAMIGMLLLAGTGREELFLQSGRIDAPAARASAFLIKDGEPWTAVGRNMAAVISLATLAFLWSAFRPGADFLRSLLPMFPMALLFAAVNSFCEEFSYRAGPLSQLTGALGGSQAVWMTAGLFGAAHLQGVPGGALGALMAGSMGWLLAKSMLETGGFFWAWLIHFLQDVLIFSFLLAPRER